MGCALPQGQIGLNARIAWINDRDFKAHLEVEMSSGLFPSFAKSVFVSVRGQ